MKNLLLSGCYGTTAVFYLITNICEKGKNGGRFSDGNHF